MSNLLRNCLYELIAEQKRQEAENTAIQKAEKDKDFNRLNELAAARIVRGEVPAGVAFRAVFDLMNSELPLMDSPLTFVNRLELAFYLKLLKDEFVRVGAAVPGEWQDRKLVEIRTKQKEIEQVLNGLINVGDKSLEVEDVRQFKEERDLTKWFRETLRNEGQPTGTPFFDTLKKYVNTPNSPLREHYNTGPKGAGIRWNTGTATGNMTKKNIQTMASKFKKSEQSKSCQ